MFLNILKYHIISNIRQKENFFWTLCFPLLLATVFNLAFSSLNDFEKTITFPVAVVDVDGSGKEIISTLEDISMLEVHKTDIQNADTLLNECDVDAIINIEKGKSSLIVINSDYSQSIIKNILDEVQQTSITINDIFSLNPDGVSIETLNLAQSNPSYINQKSDVSKNNDIYSIFFFALISMTCMFSAMTSMYSVVNIQGNQSALGARQNICPASKLTIFGANFTGDIISQYFSVVLLLFYIKCVLKYNIGNLDGWMFLFVFVSVFASLTLGTFLSSIIKLKQNNKSSIITAISLISCGLSGLFSVDIKIMIEDKIPFIKYINPATLISDGLISLYYYNSLSRYFLRISILGAFGIILFAGTCLILRGQKYDSI